MIEPLSFPELDVTAPSDIERGLLWIPVIGWMFAGAMKSDRLRPLVKEIKSQLRGRPDTSDLWKRAVPDPRGQEVAAKLMAIFQSEMGLPNSHFIPEDRIWLILSASTDGTDRSCATISIKQSFGVSLGKDISESEIRNLTLSELVQRVQELDSRRPAAVKAPRSGRGRSMP